MKLLVLATDYPRLDGTHKLMYIHVRDLYYAQHGMDVTVLNFASKTDYVMDRLRVITLATYQKENISYDILVSHAPNLRNHYRFLKKYEKKFPHIVFFFHGHEVMKRNETYPTYKYMEKHEQLKKLERGIYDAFKLRVWRSYFAKLAYKAHFVFVSNWMLNQFKQNVRLSEADLHNHVYIINNSIGSVFETETYDASCQKDFDFITIRSSLDGAKYGIDIVMNMAKNNPQSRFLLVGRGKFFDHNEKPQNVTWIDHTLNHKDMISYLNRSRCAIMMTRLDAQGVMTCELAAMGMPVITSDIDVCYEFYADLPNVRLVSNEENNVDVIALLNEMETQAPYPKYDDCFAKNTIAKEVALFKACVR